MEIKECQLVEVTQTEINISKSCMGHTVKSCCVVR